MIALRIGMVLVACLLLGACFSSHGGRPDAGQDALPDGTGPGDGEGDAVGDLGLGESFALVVPENTQACTMFLGSDHFLDVFWEYDHQARVTFRAGEYVLPRGQQNFSHDWIFKVEIGPERMEPQSISSPDFLRTLEGSDFNGRYRYDFSQTFDLDGDPYLLRFSIRFEVVDGNPVQQVVVFDEAFLSSTHNNESPSFVLSGLFADSSSHGFATCRYDLYRLVPHEITVANGDTLHLDQRFQVMDFCFICPANLTGAVFERGQERRGVTDFFRLAHTAGQHNWNQKFLVVFDSPVGDVGGILLEETESGQPATTIQYLNENFHVLETADITDYQQGW